jgi:uncharacterized membrane protein YuzA (DUF378 family)
MMGNHRGMHMLAFILLAVGGLNWLLVGLFQWDIGSIFGGMDATISRVIYVLVGLSAIYEIATHARRCRECKPDMRSMPSQ